MRGRRMRVLVKDKILTAFIELLKYNRFEDISITDITVKADVSRMAYYRNYSSKQDILDKFFESIEQDLKDEVCALSKYNKLKVFFLYLFEKLGVQTDIGMCAISGNIETMLMHVFNRYVEEAFGRCDTSPDHKYKLYFIAGAFYNVFVEWNANGRVKTAEEMADICCKMLSDTFGQI